MPPFVVNEKPCNPSTTPVFGRNNDQNFFGNAIETIFLQTDTLVLVPQEHKVMAQLANAAYAGRAVPTGWDTVDPSAVEGLEDAVFNDASSGFSATLFRNAKTGEYVVSFRGTEGSLQDSDWRNNFQQANGYVSAQYQQAMRLAQRLSKAIPGGVTFTGHSLGGGLASAAALIANRPAITYNAAGLHPSTMEAARGNLSNQNSLITAYAIWGEILNFSQDNLFLPLALGQIPEAAGRRITLDQAVPGLPLAQHSMASILAHFGCD